MIRVERLAADEVGDWESLVEKCEGHALHLPAVHLVYQPAEDLRLLRIMQDGQVVGCAVAFEQRARRLLRLPLAGRPVLYLPTAPAAAQGVGVGDIWSALIAFAHEAGFERIDVRPAYGRTLPSEGDLTRYRTGAIVEFVLDLRRGEEAVFGAMHKVHRKNMRKAAKQGLRVEEDSSLAGLLRLRELQIASSERASSRAEGFGVGDEDFFRRLHENVYDRNLGNLLFAYQNDRAVAALAWLTAAGRAVTVRSGSLPEGYRARAMYLLHDALIRRVFAEGVSELNIGGVPEEASSPEHPQSGLYEFKHGFGGQAVVRYGLDLPVEELVR